LERYEILKFYLVMSSSSEIFQDTLSTLKLEFWHENLGVGSEDFNLSFQTTGVLIINEILDFESPYIIGLNLLGKWRAQSDYFGT
jgi:hypothetical protein